MISGLEQQLAATYDLTLALRAQIDTLSPAAVAAVDSTFLLLGDVRAMVGDLRGTLSTTTPDLVAVAARLDTTMVLLTHFVREVTRSPWKTLTGVDPPPGLEPPPPGPAIAPGSPGDTVPEGSPSKDEADAEDADATSAGAALERTATPPTKPNPSTPRTVVPNGPGSPGTTEEGEPQP
jgi:hypothetical protein